MTPYPIPHNKKQHTRIRYYIIAPHLNEQTNKMFCPRSLFWCITPNQYVLLSGTWILFENSNTHKNVIYNYCLCNGHTALFLQHTSCNQQTNRQFNELKVLC